MSPPTKRIKSTKRVTSIEDLPPELISELFEYLHPKDLVACLLVNKRWHSIYAAFKLHALLATSNDYKVYHCFKLYDLNYTIREEQQFSLKTFRHLAEKPLLSNLKYLVLSGSFRFDLNWLNRFQQLVHLQIGNIFNDETNLTLPRLKVLVFHSDYFAYINEQGTPGALFIDCPLLSTLVYLGRDANLLNVRQPETIRKLETGIIDPKWLAQFKGVECLATQNILAISKATLLSLCRLRELHYNEDISSVFSWESFNGPGTLDRVRRTLNEFLNEAKKLRGNDFRFRFAGLQLTNVNVNEIDFGVGIHKFVPESVDRLYVYLKNYHLIEPGALHFVDRVFYTPLPPNVTGGFPSCFSLKFTGIHEISAQAEVPDADHFLAFLKSLKSLISLELMSTELGQEFYDQLPASAHSLISLTLRNGYCENGLQVNFDFLGRLSRLSFLYIDPDLSLESVPSFVRSLGRLENGNFFVHFKEKRFEMRKSNWRNLETTEWRICEVNREFREEFVEPILIENPEEIVSFFKRLQEDTTASAASD